MRCFNVTTNTRGVPYLSTSNVIVSDTTVDFALGFRSIAPVGYFTVRITDAIPEGTTGTLPVTLTLNGTTRNLTLPNGVAATAGDLEGVSVFLVYNDRFRGRLFLMSRTTV
jgi:hypothetical protein